MQSIEVASEEEWNNKVAEYGKLYTNSGVSTSYSKWTNTYYYAISFKGKIDGQNYTIKGMNAEGEGAGLIGVIDGAIIQNLILKNSNFIPGNSSGIVAAKAVGKGIKIKSVETKENHILIKEYYKDIGGIIGEVIEVDANLENLSSNNEIKFENDVQRFGGIIGSAWGNSCNIYKCSNYTDIVANCNDGRQIDMVAGIVGIPAVENLTINNCYNYGRIIGWQEIGGIVGEAGSTNFVISNCYNTQEIVGGWGTGGIIGFDVSDTTTINNCYNKGRISNGYESGGDVGGLIGQIRNGEIYNCYNMGKINLYLEGAINVGGTGSELGIGGLIGDANTGEELLKISNCYNNCEAVLSYPEGKSVERTIYFGNLIGVIQGNITIENSYGNTNKNIDLLPENACQFGKYIGALEANYKGEYTGTKLITGYQSNTDQYPAVYFKGEYVTQNLRQVENYASQEFCDMLNEWVGENSKYSKWIYDANKNDGLPYLEVLKDTVK